MFSARSFGLPKMPLTAPATRPFSHEVHAPRVVEDGAGRDVAAARDRATRICSRRFGVVSVFIIRTNTMTTSG